MANQTIFDLTQETSLTADDRLILQRTGASTTATSSTLALMGGLEVDNQTITTTDVTGAVGKLYVCTIAGLTANRSLTLPSANVGERIGVYISDGDATYALILKGAASQTINGGSAATEWSRLFIKGEYVIFRCVAANTWVVESDGRIPCQALVHSDGGVDQSVTDATWTQLTFFTTNEVNVGDVADQANDQILVRRAGQYYVTGQVFAAATDTSAITRVALVNSSGTFNIAGIQFYEAFPTQPGAFLSTIITLDPTTDVNLDLRTRCDFTGASLNMQASTSTFFGFYELLKP